jgi:glycosyltransferase involved in cell wall biosynthesis
LRVAFEQFDDVGWTGGVVYLQNLLEAISTLDSAEKPFTVLTRRQGDAPYNAAVDKLLEIPADPRASVVKRIYRKAAKQVGISIESRSAIAASLLNEKVDVFFTHTIYPVSAGVPLIGWIPDFQYVHLPDISGPEQVKAFTHYHRDLIRQSKVLLVSSNDVLKDLANFDGNAARGAHVIPFVAQIPEAVYQTDPGYVCAKYSIPERYFFMPNQFWKHKNHLLVVKALQILARRSVDVTVVCTGTTFDDRDRNYFSSVLTEVAMAGVHDRFRILGLVPRADVFPLQRQAMAILQPSLFEGWSTSIEEAKSLGKRVIASDLAVNIEQIPDADFFPRHDAEKLADTLEHVAKQASPGPDLAREAIARAECPERVTQFARQFVAAAREACRG